MDLFNQDVITDSEQILLDKTNKKEKIKLETKKKLIKNNLDDGLFLNVQQKAKELINQINWTTNNYKYEYLDNLLLLQKHKSKQVRKKVALSLGVLANKDHLESILKWQLQETERDVWIILETTKDKIQRRLIDGDDYKNSYIYSVEEAINIIKQNISEKKYTIEGELSDVKIFGQIYYFALKGNQDSRLDCRAFITKIIKANFPLNEGLMVLIEGKFNLNKYSKLIFEIESIKLTGEGELARNLQILENKLTQEGLFDESRKRKIPILPRKILLLASSNSAAIGDFKKTLDDRIKGLTIYHLPILTQGNFAEKDILNKLELSQKIIAEKQIEVVVITRGGGSKDDLLVFNSEKIVRAVYSLPVPSIVAIGHERDFSLTEKVADLRASTPSKAAISVTISQTELLLEIKNNFDLIKNYILNKITQYKQTNIQLYLITYTLISHQIKQFRHFSQKTDTIFYKTIHNIQNEKDRYYQNIINLIKSNIETIKLTTKKTDNYIYFLQNQILQTQKQQQFLYQKIFNLSKQNLFIIKSNYEFTYQKISLFNPELVLKLGYTLIWQENKVVEKSADFYVNKNAIIQFYDKKIKIFKK